MVQVTIPAKQPGLIPVTQDLRSHANIHTIPLQRCSNPMSDVVHSQIWTPQHARHVAPLLSIANGRDAIAASEDQSINRSDSQCRFQTLASAMVSGVKNSVRESPLFVLGTMSFPPGISRPYYDLCSNSLFRAPESNSIQTNKMNKRSLPIFAASRKDKISCSDDAT